MKRFLILVVTAQLCLMTTAAFAAFSYTKIPGVPQAVNTLGKFICQKQRDVVTPGGDENNPGYSTVDQDRFEASGRLKKIVKQVVANPIFKAGVASIKTLTTNDQAKVFDSFAKPLYPTWAMNGEISSAGTTDAGYAVEQEIATALTNAVKDAVGTTVAPAPDATVEELPFTYVPIPGVPQAVNILGKFICQKQRDVVTPGGSENAPGFSAVDQDTFDNSGRLKRITDQVTASQAFKDGVASIKTLTADDQATVFTSFAKPLYPTWAMNGTVNDTGTTDAGYAVEKEIAKALADAIKTAL